MVGVAVGHRCCGTQCKRSYVAAARLWR